MDEDRKGKRRAGWDKGGNQSRGPAGNRENLTGALCHHARLTRPATHCENAFSRLRFPFILQFVGAVAWRLDPYAADLRRRPDETGTGRPMAEKDYHAFRETHVSLLPLAVGLVFFAASLTPSLIPREWFVQGVLGGLVMAIGYMAGRFALTLWRLAELPLPRGRIAAAGDLLALLPAIAIAVWNLFRATDWQNSVRIRVAMEPTDGVHALRVLLLAMLVFLLCFVLGRLVQHFYDLLRNRLDIVMRRRTANILGLVAVGAILFIGTREGILPAAMDAADDFYETGQDLFDPEIPPPADPRMAGNVASLVDWGAMGRPGRDFIRGGPDEETISAFTGRLAKKPIRVYVGRAQAETPEERAQIALAELKRLGAFERKILIVASPTGTGWLDPGAHGTVEYMH